MKGYEIVDTNAENIGGCSFCGYKNSNNLGHRRKTDWLKARYVEGLRFKVLRSGASGDVGMIYDGKLIADRPVSARRFLHIMSKMTEPATKVTGRTPPFIGTMMRSVRSPER
jgi:hypothetical protein